MRYTHYDKHKKRWQINADYGAVMIDELNYAVGEAIDKLAAYEDAEDQGLLVRLPLKFCLLGESGNDLQDRLVHQLIDDLARAFVKAERGEKHD